MIANRASARDSKRRDDVSKLLKAYDRSRVPLYIQVASVLRSRIQSGQWAAGQKISTLDELEREFEVARQPLHLSHERRHR